MRKKKVCLSMVPFTQGKTGSFRSLNTLVTSVVNWASASMDGLKSRTPSTASEPNPSELNSTQLRLKVKSARRNASLCSNPRPTSSLSPYLQRRNKKTSLASSTGSSVGSSANGGEGGKTSRKVSRQASDGSLVLAPVAEGKFSSSGS